MNEIPLVQVGDLDVVYRKRGMRSSPPFHALRSVSFDIRRGETLGLVGESGSGKTTLGRALLGLVPVHNGTIRFDGRDVTHLSARQRRTLSSDVQVVFQDPYSSLNPSMTIESILREPLVARRMSPRDASARVAEMLDRVHLPKDSLRRYPQEFSGGQRQRVAIARALALRPRLIICDEPVSALDLSTQSLVLDLFIELQESTDVAYLFVSHDLSVVRYISHRVMVMYRGEIVETGTAEGITTAPENPYTLNLLMSSPVPDPVEQRRRRERLEAVSAFATASKT